MSDLIDRQALLKQIDIDSDGEPGYYGDTWKFIDTIKSMPPAELSTNLAEVGTEAITKQQVIDALRTCYDTETITMDNGDEYINYGDAVGEIKQLPPIQPEIVRCKDCKYGILDHEFPHKWFCSFKGNEWNYDDFFCGHAKKRGVTT